MNNQIANKLAAVVFAVLMNAVVIGSVSLLFGSPQTAMFQPAHDEHSPHSVLKWVA